MEIPVAAPRQLRPLVGARPNPDGVSGQRGSKPSSHENHPLALIREKNHDQVALFNSEYIRGNSLIWKRVFETDAERSHEGIRIHARIA